MPRRDRQRSDRSGPVEAPRGTSFRWPSRRRANAAERAAGAAADAGLERLRARAPKDAEPEAPAIESEPAAAAPERQPPAPERQPLPQEPQPPAPEPIRKPAPAPWDEELDELTEKLVAELRRDLGPELTDKLVAELPREREAEAS